MYRRTKRQISLLDPADSLPDGALQRLRASWGESFQTEVYPVLLGVEDEFRDLYGEEGRPNWSVARMLGVLLLQEMLAVTDQVALDALSFDLRWRRALAIDSSDAYLSRRSLVSFRSRLTSRDPDGVRIREVFRRLTCAARDRLAVAFTELRLDSTHVMSNIRTRGRHDLFGSTLELFVRMIEQSFGDHVALLPKELHTWLKKPSDGAFGVVSAVEARSQLPRLARWLVEVRDTFANVVGVRESEPYVLVQRLVDEHIRVHSSGTDGPSGKGGTSGDDGKIEIHTPKNPAQSLQSPHDPDAGYGYKGVGYEVQIVETCNNPGTELILDFAVQRAGDTDHGQAAAALDRLRGGGIVPDTVFADAGYISPEALLDAEARSVELHGPVARGPLPPEIIGRDAWTTDPSTGLLHTCPAGHTVQRHAERTNLSKKVSKHAYIDGSHCRDCPLRAKCLVRAPNSGKAGAFHIEDTRGLLLRDRRLAIAKTGAWKSRYAIRAGIEGTNSELKRKHGLGRLRVRRKSRVILSVTFKIAACNIKRWLRG